VELGCQQTPVHDGSKFLSTNMRAKIKSLNSKKTVNRFSKIKEVFTVKLKMIFVDHYICSHQTPKNIKNIFQKIFYAETNGTIQIPFNFSLLMLLIL